MPPPPPPPASGFASRLFLGPALRAQPDRRLVGLVRDGYESAFEEIVRRYGSGLRRYAAAIVPAHRADDVTQDAFQKALLALRSAESDVELRPWLFRIVRNTALNDLRDQPPPAAGIPERMPGTGSPAEAAERREEIADLLQRLRSLPEPQRAAIVMRELEGLSHEEIAAALGITGGAARQMLYRARRALREAGAFLVPLPALHFLLAGAGGSAVAPAAFGAAGAAGGGGAVKAGMATVLIAGSVGAGVVVSQEEDPRRPETVRIVAGPEADAGRAGDGPDAALVRSSGGDGPGGGQGGGAREGDDRSGPSGDDDERDAEDRSGPSGDNDEDREDSSGPGGDDAPERDEDRSGSSGGGHSGPGGGGETEPVEIDNSGPGSRTSGSSGSGSSGSDPSGSWSSGSDSSGSGSSGSDSSGSGSSGSGSSGSGSSDLLDPDDD